MEKIITIFLILGLVLAFVWWLWVMNTIHKIIEHRVNEQYLIHGIIQDVKELKELFKEIR